MCANAAIEGATREWPLQLAQRALEGGGSEVPAAGGQPVLEVVVTFMGSKQDFKKM